ncbi:MAG: hypothetical protein K8F54_02565, partial [Altibacter sp.]|uniref:hypothetical protein n=1 Tax=Altibacter sp. TaxID=2024823 RepID=UPI001E065EFD
MKKILLIIFLLCVVKFQAQEIKGFSFDATGGITAPLGDYKTYTKTLGQTNGNNLIGFTEEITGETQFSFDASYQFGAVGLGATLGIFNHKISSLTYEINFPTQISGGQINGTYYSIGPNYMASLGDFTFTGFLRGGLMDVSLDKFVGSYNGTDVNQPIEILNTELSSGSKSSLGYASLGVKFSYPVYQGLSAFVKAEYFTSFGDGMEILDTYVPPVDVNNDGNITSADTELFVNSDNLVEEMRFLKPQFFFFGVGLGYSFGDEDEASRERGLEDHEISGVLNRAGDDDSDGDGILDTGEQIEFERRGRRNERNILGRYPNNNSNFTDTEEVEKFSWEFLDDKIENPNYRFEIFKIRDNLELQSVYVENTSKKEINHEAAHIVQQRIESSLNDSGEGHFKWNVSETTTGITSNYSFFSIRPCQYDFSILNESIECISKDTDNRILKIC